MATGYIMVDSPNPTTPQGTLPRRGAYGALSGTCIVHTSEGAWTAGVDSLTSLVRRRADYGCYHRACDWADIALYYPWEWETWQDSETNNWAVGIAAACRTSDWGNMPADVEEGYYRNMAKMGADFVTYMRDQYGIEVPRRRISGAEARARVPGFCAHGDSGISRSDPGANFDWARFFRYMEEALAGFVYHGTITEDEMAGVNVEAANAAFDKINGMLETRYLAVDKTTNRIAVVPKGTPGSWVARVSDVGDVLGLIYNIQDATAKILEGVKNIPGIDEAVVEGLREKFEAELADLTVVLKAAPNE